MPLHVILQFYKVSWLFPLSINTQGVPGFSYLYVKFGSAITSPLNLIDDEKTFLLLHMRDTVRRWLGSNFLFKNCKNTWYIPQIFYNVISKAKFTSITNSDKLKPSPAEEYLILRINNFNIHVSIQSHDKV